MQDKENQVCLAVLPYINTSYKSIYNKTVFKKYVGRQRGLIYGDEAFIILADGSYMTAKIATITEMDWILEST